MEETTQTPAKKRKPAPKKAVAKKTRKPRTKKKVENKFLAKVKEIHGKLNYRDLALAFLVLDAAVRLIG